MSLNIIPLSAEHIDSIAPFFGGNGRERVLSATYAVFETLLDEGTTWSAGWDGGHARALFCEQVDEEKKPVRHLTFVQKGVDAGRKEGPSIWREVELMLEDDSDILSKAVGQLEEADIKKIVAKRVWQDNGVGQWKDLLKNCLGVDPEVYKDDPTFKGAGVGEVLQRGLLGSLFERVLCCNYELSQLELPGNLPIWKNGEEKTEKAIEEILDRYNIPQSLRVVIEHYSVTSLAVRLKTFKTERTRQAYAWATEKGADRAEEDKITRLWHLNTDKDIPIFPALFAQET